MSAQDPDRTPSDELFNLARLALQGSRADVEMYVHRLAHRHRNTDLGRRLATVDVVPAVSLRDFGTPVLPARPLAAASPTTDERDDR